jgi:hypothetical protein
VVNDAQFNHVVAFARGEHGWLVGRAEPERVGDEVHQDPLEQACVSPDGR